MHDAHVRHHNPVENEVLAYGEAPVARTYFVALPAGIRRAPQQPEMTRQQVDEAVGGWLVVLGNAPPDVEYIAARASGQSLRDQQGGLLSRSVRASRFNSAASRGSVSSV